jgi:polyisoprenyl-phosphate glycosyltransferase
LDERNGKEEQIEITIVIPVFMSVQILNELYERIKTVLFSFSNSWEIIMVDDGSSDNSYDIMKKIREKDRRVKIIRLDKNYGQISATLCGLVHSKGIYTITMDDDLQHPPEEIPKIINKLKDKYDVVIGKYREKKHNLFRNTGSTVVRYIIHKIMRIPGGLYLSSFRGLSRKAVNSIISYKIKYPLFIIPIVKTIPASSICNVSVEHMARPYGLSNYSYQKLFALTYHVLKNNIKEVIQGKELYNIACKDV